ncbi:MAG TPA: hypothetical protein VFW11_03580, partial [Cyclobacteriaceae bacterium]|nr:hypothetical protein [Cyclobacteriaceae bacterium]
MHKASLLFIVIFLGSCDPKVDHLTYYKEYVHTRQDILRTHGFYYAQNNDSLGPYKEYKHLLVLFDNGTFFGPWMIW